MCVCVCCMLCMYFSSSSLFYTFFQVVDCRFPGNEIDIHGYMAILIIPLLGISMIRSLKVSSDTLVYI